MINSLPKSQKKSPNKSKATLRDVAKTAGVSPTTAHNALKSKGRVSPQTVQRIRGVAEQLGYQLKKRGRPRKERTLSKKPLLRKGLPKVVALLLPEYERSFTKSEYNAQFVKWFRDFCGRCHIKPIIYRITDEQSLAKIIVRNKVEGVIFIGEPDKYIFECHLKGLPVVQAFARKNDNTWWDQVIVNHSNVGEMAASNFLEAGCKNCALYLPEAVTIRSQPNHILKKTPHIYLEHYKQFVLVMEAAGGHVTVYQRQRTGKGVSMSSTNDALDNMAHNKHHFEGVFFPAGLSRDLVSNSITSHKLDLFEGCRILITGAYPSLQDRIDKWKTTQNDDPYLVAYEAVTLVCTKSQRPDRGKIMLHPSPIALTILYEPPQPRSLHIKRFE